MTPAQEAKHLGHRTLADVARIADIKADTLRKWHKSRHDLFVVVCLGSLAKGVEHE